MNNIEIIESETSNKLAGVRIQSSGEQAYPAIYNNAVFHEINQVLKVEELVTE
jgi:hypothetical protein